MDSERIAAVRRFNRTVTRRVGALDDRYMARARPLAQARLLWEIGPDGAEVGALRARLGWDSGYLSRLLRILEGDGLVTVGPAGRVSGDGRVGVDRRVRAAALTDAGRTEWTELDTRSDALGWSFLEPLSEQHRERLVTAMATVERLLMASMVLVQPCPPSDPRARACVRAYARDITRRFEDGFDPALSSPLPDEDIAPPAGVFLLATLDGEPVGCGAVKLRPGAPAEIKRVWVADSVRGLGIGRRVLSELERYAARARLPRRPTGHQSHPHRGDRPVPFGRLPRDRAVQQRALRPPLVREAPGGEQRPGDRSAATVVPIRPAPIGPVPIR